MNPIKQAKESINELKQMVKSDDSKRMGYAEQKVDEKYEKLMCQHNRHAEFVAEKVHQLLKNGWSRSDAEPEKEASAQSKGSSKKPSSTKKKSKK